LCYSRLSRYAINIKNRLFIFPFLLAVSFSQTVAQNKPSVIPSIVEIQKEAVEAAKTYWDRRITKCGGSYYTWSSKAGELTLLEIADPAFVTTGSIISFKIPQSPDWSGSSTAKYARYRAMADAKKIWSGWVTGGTDSFSLHRIDGSWIYPSKQRSISCLDVDLFTEKADLGAELSLTIRNAKLKGFTDGRELSLGDLKGQVVILNLWASWCGPCKMELPFLAALAQKYKDKELRIIGLNVEDGDTRQIVEDIEKRLKLNFPLVSGNGETIAQLVKLSGVSVIPQSFLISRDGKLLQYYKGYSPRNSHSLADTLDIVFDH